MHHVVKYGRHCPLISCTYVFQPKRHHNVVEVAYGCFESSFFFFFFYILGAILILLYPLNPSKNENMVVPAAESISKSMFGNGNSSFGQTLLRFLKSTQYLICLFFFFTSTMLDSQHRC